MNLPADPAALWSLLLPMEQCSLLLHHCPFPLKAISKKPELISIHDSIKNAVLPGWTKPIPLLAQLSCPVCLEQQGRDTRGHLGPFGDTWPPVGPAQLQESMITNIVIHEITNLTWSWDLPLTDSSPWTANYSIPSPCFIPERHTSISCLSVWL